MYCNGECGDNEEYMNVLRQPVSPVLSQMKRRVGCVDLTSNKSFVVCGYFCAEEIPAAATRRAPDGRGLTGLHKDAVQALQWLHLGDKSIHERRVLLSPRKRTKEQRGAECGFCTISVMLQNRYR